MANAGAQGLSFELPPPPAGRQWLTVVDTARPSPGDIAGPDAPALPAEAPVKVAPHSIVVLLCRP
jgi:hypothetical protein